MAHTTRRVGAHPPAASTLSLPWVVAAAVLSGAGLFVLMYFILTFQLIYLGGIALVVVGGLMLFDRRAGPDHA